MIGCWLGRVTGSLYSHFCLLEFVSLNPQSDPNYSCFFKNEPNKVLPVHWDWRGIAEVRHSLLNINVWIIEQAYSTGGPVGQREPHFEVCDIGNV